MRVLGLFLLLVSGLAAHAQTRVADQALIVTGTYEPLPLEEADRSLHVFFLIPDSHLLACTVSDFFRLDPSLDLRGRAPAGIQSDLSIRGANFGQTLVLMDGVRVNDAQSGHHNLDIPLPLEALARIEVLKGAGSAFYGSDAVGGVVNLITKTPEASEFRLRAALGNFGVNQQAGTLALVYGPLSQMFSFSRDFSTGFAEDRDYRNLALASVTHLTTRLGPTSVVLSSSDKPFGANRFYGNFNSWERTRTWFAAIRQSLGANTDVSFAYRRHTDLFVLYRDRPSVFTNRHLTGAYQVRLARRNSVAKNIIVSYGGEGYHDAIDSNNLGHHKRNRGAAYGALDVRAVRRFSFTVAAREEIYRGNAHRLSPMASVGAWLNPRIKVRGNISSAFRLPSYTDLYYHDPANLGSPDLRPEKAWNYEGGVDWRPWDRVRAEGTVFTRRERDGIDYVRRSSTDVWRATNFQRLNFTGIEAALVLTPRRWQQLDVRYTGLHGVQEALGTLHSKYTFNYPVHNGVVSWQLGLSRLLLRTRIGVLERLGRDPYAVWDAYIGVRRGRWTPFAQFTNLTETRYQEIQGVNMPGRAALVGVEWRAKF